MSDPAAAPAESAPGGADPPTKAVPENAVPVIGVGASAGGLEAFLRLLEALPVDGGPAYVFLVHLAADHSSSMPEILGRVTRMPVREATDGAVVERGTCYTNPPDRYVTLEGDVLRTQVRPPRESPPGQRGRVSCGVWPRPAARRPWR